jgi:adhesin/invasin
MPLLPLLSRAHFFRFQVVNTQVISGLFSTLAGTSISVDWGDGYARSTYTGTDQVWSKDYGSAGNRLVRIYGAQNLTKFTMIEAGANVQFDLADLPTGMTYFSCHGSNTVTGDLADLPADLATCICHGYNTVTGDLADLPAGMTYFSCAGSNTVSGDLADLPAGMTYFFCGGSNTVTGDLADLPADLATCICHGYNTVTGDLADLPAGMTYFFCTGSNTVTGDLADLPAGMTYFRCTGSNTINAYTGKTWTTKPATFALTGLSSLDQTEVDNLLIDFDADLVWAAGNTITITGNCAAPGAAGLAAIANIEAEGATVTVNT